MSPGAEVETLLGELARRGVQVELAPDGNLVLSGTEERPAELIDALREAKPRVIEVLRQQNLPPQRPCYACHSLRFWMSVYGVVTCAVCHPPASPSLVKQWVELPGCEPTPQARPTASPSPGETVHCPYDLPAGVRLRAYTPKTPPVAVTVCSVVNDLPKFIRHALAELDARLHRPIQIRAGDSTFELLSKLADCGLELLLEWPPKSNAQEVEISDEALPF